MADRKQRRYGQANNTAVSPQLRRIPSTPDRTRKDAKNQPVDVRTKGVGPYAVDVDFDRGENALVVTRGGVGSDAIDGARWAEVMWDCAAVDPEDPLPTITNWYPTNPDGTINYDESPLIDPTWTHEDGFPVDQAPRKNIPDGMVYVRLMPGSTPVAEARWDADQSDEGSTDTLPDTESLRMIRAHIIEYGDNANKVNAVIRLTFNYAAFPFPFYTQMRVKKFKFRSEQGGKLRATDCVQGARANELDVTLSRALNVDERVFTMLKPGVALDQASRQGANRNIKSSWIATSALLDKACYVLIVNRSSKGEALSAGDRIQIGKNIQYSDDEGGRNLVYDATQFGGAGGGTDLYIGKIIGGNAMPLDADGNEFPDIVHRSLPMDLSDDDGNIYENPEVDDWTKYELDDTWSIGDTLTALPNGVCFLQLQRPYDLDGAAWDANIPGGYRYNDDTVLLATRVVSSEDFKQIKIHWNQECQLNQNGTAPSSYDLTILDSEGVSQLVPDTNQIENVKQEGATTVLTLREAMDTDAHTYYISFGDIAYTKNPDDATITNEHLAQQAVTYLGDSNTLVYGLNSVSYQSFQLGTLVLFEATATPITDDNGVTRNTYRILGPATSAAIHDHLSYDSDGQGRASLSARGFF